MQWLTQDPIRYNTHIHLPNTHSVARQRAVCEGTFSMCVMSAGDREGEPIISRLCVCVGLSSDTRRLLIDPPGYGCLL